jgi:uncharacterized membrane protein YgcG
MKNPSVFRLAAMPAWRRSALLAVAALAALAGGGCGKSKELPADIPAANAQGLLQNLQLVQERCAAGDQQGAVDAAQNYAVAVEALPDTVNADVMTVLRQTATNLHTLAQSDTGCKPETGPSGLSGAQPDTTTTAATTTTTTTTTTPPADTTSTETSSPPPPDQGNGGSEGGTGNPTGGGNSGGNGGGNGSSGGVGAGKSGDSHARHR